jgi:hypothetical protein
MAASDLSLHRAHGFTPHRWRNPVPRLVRRLQEFQAGQTELHERVLLRQEPWLEEYLHWSYDGGQWRLHGRYPAKPGARPSVTRSGWCPHAAG